MKLAALGIAAGLLFAAQSQAGPVGYTLDVTTGYQFACPAIVVGTCGSPDTGFFEVMNNGTTTFVGTIGLHAITSGGIDDSTLSGVLTLAPGAIVFITDLSGESSNVGGYNGPFGSPQLGATLNIDGMMNGVEAIALSVSDSAIHSGVSRVTPCGAGLLSDAYVFQGGAPTGCDTGDAFETTQAPGHFEFFEAVNGAPEPTSLALIAIGLLGLGVSRRKG